MDEKRVQQARLLVIVLVVLVIGYFIFSTITRHGKVKLQIQVAPADSVIRVDGKQVKAGGVYVKPGTYTINASREDFKTDWQKITVKEGQERNVYLLPEPESDKAHEYLQDNPSIQARREALGGQKANQKGIDLVKEYPILDYLPVSWNHGLTSIGSGKSPTIEGGTAIYIRGTSTADRNDALNWIRDRGFNPADYEIVFTDFINNFEQDLPREDE